MTEGVKARDLSDDDLLRELVHLKEKAGDIDSAGTADQRANHRTRTAELEEEFLRRNPAGTPDPAHVDKGSGADDDAAPAGPDDGPLDDQPEPHASREQAPVGEQPSDGPTDDPDRPANPA